MTRATAAVSVLAIVMVVGPGTALADRCTASKLKALAKKEQSLLTCSGREATQGTSIQPACNANASTKFTKSYNKTTGCSTPPATQCEDIADRCQAMLRAALPDGNATSPSSCESARLRAAGRKASAKLKCYAKAAQKNVAVTTGPGSCLDRADQKFQAAFTSQSGCTGDAPGSAANIEMLIDDECVDAAVTLSADQVTGICPTTTTTTSTTTTTTLATCGPSCHSVCTTGTALCNACSDPCAATVCTEDPACCDPAQGWTALCVSEVNSFCCPSGGTCCP